ncbi:MAG: FtsX-like permease family protein [Vicinamibacterales bacterium]
MTEIRLALRSLLHARSFALLAVLTLGTGIGLTAGIFAVVDGILFKPLPYEEPERLFRMMTVSSRGAGTSMPGTVPELALATGDVAGVTTVGPFVSALVLSTDSDQVFSGVSVGFGGMEVLRPRLAIGRLPAAATTPSLREAALRYETWITRFGGGSDIIGRTLTFERMELMVVGVLERGIVLPGTGPVARFDLIYENPQPSAAPRNVIAPVGRLAAGARFEDVQAKLAVTTTGLFGSNERASGSFIRVRPLQEDVFALQRDGVVTLFGASGLLLLLATVNVANLMLARGMSRQHVFAIQRSLGASSGRLARQTFAESALLVLASSVLGLALCQLAFRLIVRYVPPTLTALVPTTFGWRGFAFGIAVAAVTLPVLAAVAVLQVSRQAPATVLPRTATGAGSTSLRRGRGGWMLASEAAVALVLIAAASLMIASFAKAVTRDTGYDADGLKVVSISWADRASTPPQRFARTSEILNTLREHPDVGRAASIDFSHFGNAARFRGISTNREIRGGVMEASHDFADVMGLTLLEGRWFTEDEQQANAPVAVVTHSAARQLAADGARLGEYYTSPRDVPRLIVGIVGDIREDRLDEPKPDMFVPAVGAHRGFADLVVRPRRPGTDLAALATSLARRHDVRARAVAIEVADVLGRQTELLRFQAALFGGFGWVALLVAAVGIYAVQRYLIERRRFEMGVRLALGAEPRSLARMVLSDALKPVLAGSVAGVGLGVLLLRGLESLVFGIEVLNPVVFVVSAGLLAVASALAALGPARQASRVDPIVVLKAE